MVNRFQRKYDCLGSKAFLTITTNREEKFAELIFDELIDKIDRFEDRFSRFKDSSELTKINRNAGTRTKISQPMKEILLKVQDYSKITHGVFNPFILPTLQKVGYKNSWNSPETDSPDFSGDVLADYKDLNIKDNSLKIPEQSAIDLGGIGKGYLLDQLSLFLDKKNLDGYWLSLGGDIICKGININKQPFEINIASSLDGNKTIDSIVLKDNHKISIATSGITKRNGYKNNSSWHHLINPKTKSPSKNNILSATVIAGEASTADVMAKSIVIEGEEFAKLALNKQWITGYLMQCLDNAQNLSIIRKGI
jgi:thiamine biosynthesis lipoprotein